MNNVIWKLGVLYRELCAAHEHWRAEVWERNPDAVYCCYPSQHAPCGCGAVTIREMYTPRPTGPVQADVAK